ncbi:MAG: hypothetical protein Q4D30_08185 [Bacteroidales bacterium]|nr:hypothetical protein [Bacteroidales bacterium]
MVQGIYYFAFIGCKVKVGVVMKVHHLLLTCLTAAMLVGVSACYDDDKSEFPDLTSNQIEFTISDGELEVTGGAELTADQFKRFVMDKGWRYVGSQLIGADGKLSGEPYTEEFYGISPESYIVFHENAYTHYYCRGQTYLYQTESCEYEDGDVWGHIGPERHHIFKVIYHYSSSPLDSSLGDKLMIVHYIPEGVIDSIDSSTFMYRYVVAWYLPISEDQLKEVEQQYTTEG